MLRVLLGLAAAHSCADQTLACFTVPVPADASGVVQSPDGELHCLADHPYHRCAEGELPCCRGGAPAGHEGPGGRGRDRDGERGDRGDRRGRGDKDCNRNRGGRDGDRDGHHGDHDDHHGDHDDHHGDHDDHHGAHDDHGTVGLLGSRGVRGPGGKPKRGEAVVEVHIAGRDLAAVQALAPEQYAQWRDEAMLVVSRAAQLGRDKLRLLAVKQGSVVLVLAVAGRDQARVLEAKSADLQNLCALTPGDGDCAVTVRAAQRFPLGPVAGGAAALAVLALVGLKRRAATRSAATAVLPAGANGNEQTTGNEQTAEVEVGAKASEVGVKALDASAATPSTAAPEDVADLAAVPGDPIEA